MNSIVSYCKKHKWEVAVFCLILLRLIVDAWLPLLDKTEARYAEIARIMYETNNWVTPQIDYDVPFWAKPPMSTWLSAASFNVFGVNELGARFPSFLLQILLLVFVAKSFHFSKNSVLFLLL